MTNTVTVLDAIMRGATWSVHHWGLVCVAFVLVGMPVFLVWRDVSKWNRQCKQAQAEAEKRRQEEARQQREKEQILEDSGISIIDGWSKQERGTKFEDLMAWYFEQRGLSVRKTRTSGDYGADLLVTNPSTRRTVAVQCKCFDPQRKVGVKAIHEVVGSLMHYQVKRGMVITNVTFTQPAINLAESNNVIRWDRDELIDRLAKLGRRRRET